MLARELDKLGTQHGGERVEGTPHPGAAGWLRDAVPGAVWTQVDQNKENGVRSASSHHPLNGTQLLGKCLKY